MASLTNTNLLADIRRENLNVYRSSPQRLREDVGQEAQIAQDYRGRLIYELLQNADDAMEARDGDARICFRLTPDSLWVANSGRPLDDADIRGLCGISASSKRVSGKKRASIGHKGMGFKSVLEITDSPEVYSTTACFRFSPDDALKAVQVLVDDGLVDPVRHAPICRFPWATDEREACWLDLHSRGFRTAFRFPLRGNDQENQHAKLATALQSLPESSLLFLKRLKSVEIELGHRPGIPDIAWTIKRHRFGQHGSKAAVNALDESGVYSVDLTNAAGVTYSFVLAHDAEIRIGDHRGGLNEFAWEGVELTEAAVAARIAGGILTELPAEWRRLHVFLPSGEPCPYDLLISAAFNSNLSRQEIKIGSNDNDYNHHLLQRIAQLFRDQLVSELIRSGASIESVLRLLDRRCPPGVAADAEAAQTTYESFKAALAECPLIPTEANSLVTLSNCAVPPLVRQESIGQAFRHLLAPDAEYDGKSFPTDAFCGGDLARILVDHGAYELGPAEAAYQLAATDPARSQLSEHPSGGVNIDPVLSALEGLWSGLEEPKRATLVHAVRQLPLFPVGATNGRVTRIITKEVQCFYPPRSLKGEVGLSGLCFLLQDLCWGALNPTERNELLAREMAIWHALFDVREFKFPDVMRASVLPSLDLDRDASDPRRAKLRSFDSLAEICQLAGRMPDLSKPLPYERLGPNRALFNLSRLDVPCRGESGGIKWVPAYRAYLGEDWVGEASFERVCKAVAACGGTPPEVDFLVGPAYFAGRLDRFRHLERATTDEDEDVGTDEVALDEDEEAALESDDHSRWLEFLRWLGVNLVQRPVHFHDVEDRASGWLKTRNLSQPEGWAFSNIPTDKWTGFLTTILPMLVTELQGTQGAAAYFYQLHDLEHIVPLLEAAARDATASVGRAIYHHLATNWAFLDKFSHLKIALVPGEPARRTKPPRAREDEIIEIEQGNFWVYRLRNAAVCPTGHGPRRPSEVWLPTQEVTRRFGRRSRDGFACLLPTIDLPPNLLKGRARGLMQAMAIREELSPASFSESDALVVLRRIHEVFGEKVRQHEDLRQDLREVIRPAYRNLLELLSGRAAATASEPMKQAPLLAHDGLNNFEFRPAEKVFYAERRDTRDRLRTNAPLWTFVLEAYPTGRGPLIDLFGCRVLEESLRWSPKVSESDLSDAEKTAWRAHLRELAPYILARVGADRVEEAQARRDAARLRALIAALEPVAGIQLTCDLDGQEIPSQAIEREAFVEAHDDPSGKMLAFVRWGEHDWPPTEDEAEALAVAFGELLGPSYFESFLALVRAPSNAKRENFLRRAGAPTDIEERRQMLFEDGSDGNEQQESSPDQPPQEPMTASAQADGEQPAHPPAQGAALGEQTKQAPLYGFEQILVDGSPVVLHGTSVPPVKKPSGGGDPGDTGNDGHPHENGSGYGGHTDLEMLNALGMAITLSYEVARLRRAGARNATVFDPASSEPQPHALVFNVSTPGRIAKARESCEWFDRAFRRLMELHGISPEWPGFDVITLNPAAREEVERVIELKSSGVCSRIQEMSWNEWKSARSNQLRQRFYLYLVGNLRSDLNGTKPFVRTIRDPFEQLLAEISLNKRVERKVHLAVNLFREAEHLDLSVREVQTG